MTPLDLVPQITDDSGYCITMADLGFLQVEPESVDDWRSQVRPLGLSHITCDALINRLWDSLAADRISPEEVDVRLKGSAAAFFSGRHKFMPVSRDDLVALFRSVRGRFPELFEILEVEHRLNVQWPLPNRPLRRPFDSLYRLGIDRVPSDYDLQISSDAIVARCEATASGLNIQVTREATFNDAYNFIRKDLLRASMPHLSEFAALMSDALQRDITVAVFPSAGPPDLAAEIGELSAHFRPTDWCIRFPSDRDVSA